MNNKIFQPLLSWYEVHKRALPWRGEEDPYKIWVSEIILQQTRVNQGWEYYERFVSRFPTFFALAEAPLESVLLVWQGLGYYSRARNMHTAANQIVNNFGGKFPNNFQDLLKLKGVGRYTAAAIASIAFQEKKGAVDGNVLRVVSRLFGIYNDISAGKTVAQIEQIVDRAIVDFDPAEFNQAMMELGALVCQPKKWECSECPFASNCYAYINEKQHLIPIKKNQIKMQTRYFHFFYYEKNGKILIEQRDDKEIWKNLYQLPLVEIKVDELLEESPDFLKLGIKEKQLLWKGQQKLTHQHLHLYIWKAEFINNLESLAIWVAKDKLSGYPFPKVIGEFLMSGER